MPYGESIAFMEKTSEGEFLVIRIKLPTEGEPSQRGHAMNLTDPKFWGDVSDLDGGLTNMRYTVTVCVPDRWASPVRVLLRRRTDR